jgi:DNA-repair protein XRCC1
MSLHECKNGLNVNKVRFFNSDQLSPACKESWDRVKIVCTQPYIKQAKFGLSFITFHTKDEPKKKPIEPESIQLGAFTLRNYDDPDDLTSVGRLFSKRHENREMVRMPESPVNRLLALHKRNLNAEKHKNTDYKTNINSPSTSQKISKTPKDSLKTNKIELDVKKKPLSTSLAIQKKGMVNIFTMQIVD